MEPRRLRLFLAQAGSHQFTTTGAMSAARSLASGAPLSGPGVSGGTDGLLLVAGGASAGNNLASAEVFKFVTIKTDKGDYAPGTPVIMTGSGWQSGETVTLYLQESPQVEPNPVLTTVADANGNIYDSAYAPDNFDLGIRYYMTAVGSASGLQAQTTFTDASNTTISGTVKNGSTGIGGVTITAYTNSSLGTLEGGSANPTTSAAGTGNWTLALSKDSNTVYVVMTSSSYTATGGWNGGNAGRDRDQRIRGRLNHIHGHGGAFACGQQCESSIGHGAVQ